MQGSSDIDQLGKIFAAFGTPKPSQWHDMVYLPDYVEYQFVPAPPLRSLFPMASDDALDLLSKMFTYDPKTRISAQQALEHRSLIFGFLVVLVNSIALFVLRPINLSFLFSMQIFYNSTSTYKARTSS